MTRHALSSTAIFRSRFQAGLISWLQVRAHISKEFSMNDLTDDPLLESDRLKRHIRFAALSALANLTRAARGEKVFESDQHLRASVALLRLIPALMVASDSQVEPPRSIELPDIA